MLINIVPIGNSKGIRLPKSIIDQCHIGNKVNLEIEDGKIILKPVHKNPRENWAKQFEQMHLDGDDNLLIEDTIDLESENWEW